MTEKSSDEITLTKADFLAMADRIATHQACDMSKAQVLNIMAASVLGPKHDWSRIKGAETPVLSQRVRARGLQPAAVPAPAGREDVVLRDIEDDSITRVSFLDREPGSITLQADDGQVVWIERNAGRLKVHVYNATSDGPMSIWSGPTEKIHVNDEDYRDGLYPMVIPARPAGDDLPPVIGFQVWDPLTGAHWGERPSFEVLPRDMAERDLEEARAAGVDDFFILPVREGDIEEPDLSAFEA